MKPFQNSLHILQRLTSENDINSWMKRVEDASNVATAQVFGVEYGSGACIGKNASRLTSEHVRECDATYTEAQELLNEWMREKVHLDSGFDIDDDDDGDGDGDVSIKIPSVAQVRREWDDMILQDVDDKNLKLPRHVTHKAIQDYDLLNQDETEIMDTILQNMMNKEVVKDNFKQDLGLDEKRNHSCDPRTKMMLRHQQVKENRERREKELEKKRRQQSAQKDARLKAKQIVMREENEKASNKKKEEEELQKEMAKIRREMEDQRKTDEAEQLRKKREMEAVQCKVREEFEKQHWENQQQEIIARRNAEELRRQALKRLDYVEAQITVNNYKIMQKCFSAWYNIVLERRMQFGKVRAMADWKCLLRAWNAWKSYTRARRSERDVQLHEQYIRDQHKKSQLAYEHYCWVLLRKCFTAWQVFIISQQHENSAAEAQNTTRSKMSAFLEAAASGKLWEERTVVSSPSSKNSPSVRDKQLNMADENVDHLFAQNIQHPDTVSNLSECSTDRSDFDQHKIHSWKPPPLTKPREAWQVTKRHVNLSPKEIASMGSGPQGDVAIAAITNKIRHFKSPVIVNNFENRHNAQQKILKEQQQQLQEQKRLIEELSYLQKQQILQHQLQQQQLLTQQLNDTSQSTKAAIATPMIPNTMVKQKTNKGHVRTSSLTQGQGQSSNVGNETDRSASSTVTSKASCRHEDFVRAMELRAEERQRIKLEREEKRCKAEEERLAQLQAEEKERVQQDAEEIQIRLEARRKQKRLEKQREAEKQILLERSRKQHEVAICHNRLSVMRYHGWIPWRRLLLSKYEKESCAEEQFRRTLLRRVLAGWYEYSQKAILEQNAIAEDHNRVRLLHRCFKNWKRYGNYMSILEEKAVLFHNQRLLWKVVKVWANFATEEKLRMWKLERLAKEYNSQRVVKTTFRAWVRLPDIENRERQKEASRLEMRRKVTSILPDFRASDNVL